LNNQKRFQQSKKVSTIQKKFQQSSFQQSKKFQQSKSFNSFNSKFQRQKRAATAFESSSGRVFKLAVTLAAFRDGFPSGVCQSDARSG
jgi:hypothetical protein